MHVRQQYPAVPTVLVFALLAALVAVSGGVFARHGHGAGSDLGGGATAWSSPACVDRGDGQDRPVAAGGGQPPGPWAAGGARPDAGPRPLPALAASPAPERRIQTKGLTNGSMVAATSDGDGWRWRGRSRPADSRRAGR